MTRTRLRAVFLAAALLAVGACGDDEPDATTTSAAADETTTTSVAPADDPTTTVTAAEEPAADDPTTTIAPEAEGEAPVPVDIEPGDPCSVEEGLPDCIDPDGDGEGTFLIGGADCIATFPDDPGLCEDLDGDGNAGYPDSG